MAAVARKKQTNTALINGLPWRRKTDAFEWHVTVKDLTLQINRPVAGVYKWSITRGEEVLVTDTTHGDAFWEATTVIQKYIKASETLAYVFAGDDASENVA